MPEHPTPQAPVAGADPRAWRELAERCDFAAVWLRDIDDDTPARERANRVAMAAALIDENAAALRDAAEAVTEAEQRAAMQYRLRIDLVKLAERYKRERDVARDAAAETVTERDGEADALQGQLDERDDLLRRLCELLTPEGDRGTLHLDCLLPAVEEVVRERDDVRARLAAAERVGVVAEEAVARVRELASMAPGAARVMGLAAILADYDATIAPRPSGRPAATTPDGMRAPIPTRTPDGELAWVDAMAAPPNAPAAALNPKPCPSCDGAGARR